MSARPFDGGVFIGDTSAWGRAVHESVVVDWRRAVADGQIATCAPVVMEMFFSARDEAQLARIDARIAELREIPVSRSVTRAAVGAMRELARVQPLYHRIPVADLLVAAAASEAAIGVLHYDRHYDRLAEVLPFESRWIAPAGSLG